ncbi:MAG TPA: PAS domain S-box protein [Pirellulales bacterium]|nr:PAS domain S-box protein [Pirellulales bacterium]
MMRSVFRSTTQSLGIAIFFVATAVAIRLALMPWIGGHAPFVAIWLAVLLAAAIGGWQAGSIAIVIGAAANAYFIFEPQFNFDVADPGNRVRFIAFFIASPLAVALVERMRRATQRARRLGAEASLQRELLRTTLLSVGDAVLATDSVGRVTFMNPTAESMTGTKLEEVLGKGAATVLRLQSVGGGDAGDPVSDVLQHARTRQNEHAVLPIDGGQLCEIEYTATPIRAQSDKVVGAVVVFRDVSVRQAAERALASSEAEYRESFEHAAVGKVEADPQTCRILRVNSMLCTLTGYTREELCSLSVWDLPHPDDVPASKQEFERLIRGEIDYYTNEKRYVCKDQSTRWVSVTASLLRDPQGQPLRVLAVIHDLSQRKLAEEALERKDAELQYHLHLTETIASRAAEALYLIDAHGMLTYMNPAAEAMFGWTFAELKGKRLHDVIHYKHPDGSPYPARECPIGRIMNAGQPIHNHEDVFFHRDGHAVPVLCSNAPVERNGALIGAVLMVNDITERKHAEDALRESEARFRQLADVMPQIAWAARADGYIDYFNRRWFEYTGMPEGTTGEAAWDPIIHPEDRVTTRKLWYEAVATGLPYQSECRLLSRQFGRYRWHLERALPIRDAQGLVVRWFGTSTDIDDQKRAEEALLAADRRKDQFLAMLAHELRNPMGPVRNAVEVLRMLGPFNADVEEMHDVIGRQIAHMAHLVDDLLDVARISRGKIILRREPLELGQLLSRVAGDQRLALEDVGLTFDVKLDARPLWIEGDATRIAQVVGNLLSNSAKFTERGGRIELILNGFPDRHRAEIVVRDTGIGMSSETVATAFEVFSQADSSLDRSRGGLGLGLALVRGLVELHNGEVSAASPGVGKGAEFAIRLPLLEEPVIVVETGPHDEGRKRPARIVVIDDRRDSSHTMSRMLERFGHEVAMAADGESGLQTIREFRPDIVLCDIGLPGGISGYDIARTIRADESLQGIYLAAVTGYGQEEDRRQAIDAGFNIHMTKPVSLDQLKKVLASAPLRDSCYAD